MLSFAEALREIETLVDSGQGGAVFTPNVDHVIKAESNEAFRRAYEDASLSLADGMPLVWVAGLLGCPLPERVAGSDLLVPLLELAARRQVEGLSARWCARRRGGHGQVTERGISASAVVGWDDCLIGNDGSDVTRGLGRASARGEAGSDSGRRWGLPSRSSGFTARPTRYGRRWRSASEPGSTSLPGSTRELRAGWHGLVSSGRSACSRSLAGCGGDISSRVRASRWWF